MSDDVIIVSTPAIHTHILFSFSKALEKYILQDDSEYSGWTKSPPAEFTEFVFHRINTFYKAWKLRGERIPWLKIAALVLVSWAQVTHPGLLSEEARKV